MAPQDYSSLLNATVASSTTDSIVDTTKNVFTKIDSINASVKDSLENLQAADI